MSVDKVTGESSKHFGDVTSICYQNEHLFSAGSDGKIKVCTAAPINSTDSKTCLIFFRFLSRLDLG